MLREMTDTIIENPIINSPFEEPQRHFRFDDAGITNEIVEKRRVSSYFMPIAKARKRSAQLSFETEWTKDRIGVPGVVARKCTVRRIPRITLSWFVIQFY
jgi:hypothetical protein